MNPGHSQEASEVDNMGNEANTQLLELQGALMDALTNMGLLGKLKAQLRAVTLGLLRSDPNLSLAAVGHTKNFAQTPTETQISLLIIEDFFASHHLTQTAGVFEVEAGTSHCSKRANEQMRSSIATLPGEGAILERLVNFVINENHASKSHLLSSTPSAPTSSKPETVNQSTQERNMDSAKKAQAPLPKLSNTEALSETVTSNGSIPYSDVDESLDEDLYDEIELF